jgi:hypothetical protein
MLSVMVKTPLSKNLWHAAQGNAVVLMIRPACLMPLDVGRLQGDHQEQ